MNKELIKKYKTEFNHWLNDGVLLSKHPDEINWYTVTTVLWNNPNMQYIIDDKYVEFRKAMAEDKTIQLHVLVFQDPTDLSTSVYDWMDYMENDSSFEFTEPIEKLRIKPEIVTKIGDWLFNLRCKTYHRIDNLLKDKVELNGSSVLLSEVTDRTYQLWEPKVGEWCIVDDPNSSDRDSIFTVQKWGLTSKWTPAPYTGPLPYFIKD